MSNLFVDQGSIYNPGWHVVEQVSECHQRVLTTFTEKADADEHLAYIQQDQGDGDAMNTPAPSYRAVDPQTGLVIPPPPDVAENYLRTIALANGLGDTTMAVTIREIDDMRTELAKMTEQRDDARAEVDSLTDLLKAMGKNVADLATTLAQYQAERDEYREKAEEYRDQFDLACDERDEALTHLQELKTELAEARNARDTANARASL